MNLWERRKGWHKKYAKRYRCCKCLGYFKKREMCKNGYDCKECGGYTGNLPAHLTGKEYVKAMVSHFDAFRQKPNGRLKVYEKKRS